MLTAQYDFNELDSFLTDKTRNIYYGKNLEYYYEWRDNAQRLVILNKVFDAIVSVIQADITDDDSLPEAIRIIYDSGLGRERVTNPFMNSVLSKLGLDPTQFWIGPLNIIMAFAKLQILPYSVYDSTSKTYPMTIEAKTYAERTKTDTTTTITKTTMGYNRMLMYGLAIGAFGYLGFWIFSNRKKLMRKRKR